MASRMAMPSTLTPANASVRNLPLLAQPALRPLRYGHADLEHRPMSTPTKRRVLKRPAWERGYNSHGY